MKCELQLQEQYNIKILLRNIHVMMPFLLKEYAIKTFEKLINKATNL